MPAWEHICVTQRLMKIQTLLLMWSGQRTQMPLFCSWSHMISCCITMWRWWLMTAVVVPLSCDPVISVTEPWSGLHSCCASHEHWHTCYPPLRVTRRDICQLRKRLLVGCLTPFFPSLGIVWREQKSLSPWLLHQLLKWLDTIQLFMAFELLQLLSNHNDHHCFPRFFAWKKQHHWFIDHHWPILYPTSTAVVGHTMAMLGLWRDEPTGKWGEWGCWKRLAEAFRTPERRQVFGSILDCLRSLHAQKSGWRDLWPKGTGMFWKSCHIRSRLHNQSVLRGQWMSIKICIFNHHISV